MFHATHIPKGTTCTTCKSPSYILVVEWGHVLIKPSNHGGDLPEKSHRAPRWQQTHATWHNSSLLRRCRRKGLALSSKLTEFTSRLKLQNWMCHHLNFQTLYISQYWYTWFDWALSQAIALFLLKAQSVVCVNIKNETYNSVQSTPVLKAATWNAKYLYTVITFCSTSVHFPSALSRPFLHLSSLRSILNPHCVCWRRLDIGKMTTSPCLHVTAVQDPLFGHCSSALIRVW